MLGKTGVGQMMLSLLEIGELIAAKRREMKMSQSVLGKQARISRATIVALEGGTLPELGFGKVSRLLAVVGLELRAGIYNMGRPTLEDLVRDDEALRHRPHND